MGTSPYFAYGAVGLKGGTGARLDNIESSVLSHNDLAVVLHDNKIYFYRLDSESGENENEPYIIKPVTETGDRRWILISQEIYNSNIIQLLEHYIQTSHIKAIENNDLIIETGDGNSIIIRENGDVIFPSIVEGSEPPTENSHLTNKQYVDEQFNIKESNLESYLDIEYQSYVDSEVDTKETELKEYIDTEIPIYVDKQFSIKEDELKQYTDDEIEKVYPLLTVEIDSWNEDSESYYYDIEHNKNFYPIIRCWKNGDEMIYPEKIEYIDNNNIKIRMPVNENLTVILM